MVFSKLRKLLNPINNLTKELQAQTIQILNLKIKVNQSIKSTTLPIVST